MNYTDFGVKGPEELEQDEWSLHGGEDGGRPTFETPKGGVLTVLGVIGAYVCENLYLVTCSSCAQDPELFGDGVFRSCKTSLRRKQAPCGCTKSRLSESQYKVIVKRTAESRGYTFLGWDGDFKKSQTKCRILCPEHREWKVIISAFLRPGRTGCPECHTPGEEERRGQIEGEIARRREEGVSNLKFVRWKSKKGYIDRFSKFIFLCQTHGRQEADVTSFLKQKSGCRQCAGKNQQQAYINLVSDGGLPLALKLGISNDSGRRIYKQNIKNLFQSTPIGVWKFEEVDQCYAAEKKCKQTLNTGVLSAREMEDGHTETVSILDLEKVIAIYEKHGGVRIK